MQKEEELELGLRVEHPNDDRLEMSEYRPQDSTVPASPITTVSQSPIRVGIGPGPHKICMWFRRLDSKTEHKIQNLSHSTTYKSFEITCQTRIRF